MSLKIIAAQAARVSQCAGMVATQAARGGLYAGVVGGLLGCFYQKNPLKGAAIGAVASAIFGAIAASSAAILGADVVIGAGLGAFIGVVIVAKSENSSQLAKCASIFAATILGALAGYSGVLNAMSNVPVFYVYKIN